MLIKEDWREGWLFREMWMDWRREGKDRWKKTGNIIPLDGYVVNVMRNK